MEEKNSSTFVVSVDSGKSLSESDDQTDDLSQHRNGSYHTAKAQYFTKQVKLNKDTNKVTYSFHTSDTQDSDDDVQELESSGEGHCHSKMKKAEMDKKARTKLVIASALCLCFMSGEMVGGYLASSLAIMSDAAHLLTDFASFMISLMAMYLAYRPATRNLSFGWYRAEILGAFASILLLWVLTGVLCYSAVNRIIDSNYDINATIMLITAAVGVAFNVLLGTTLHQHSHSHGGHGHSHGSRGHDPTRSNLEVKVTTGNDRRGYGSTGHRGGGGGGIGRGGGRGGKGGKRVGGGGRYDDVERQDEAQKPLLSHDKDQPEGHGHSHRGSNINVKAAFIHVLGDLTQSIGVLVAAFIIYFKPEWKIADPICTFLFSLFVLITTITIMRDIVVVLMEGTPRGINFIDVQNALLGVDGVLDIHNLRVWSLTMDKIAMSVHLAIDKQSDPHRVLRQASEVVQEMFNISETTMQVEVYVTEMDDCKDCKGPTP